MHECKYILDGDPKALQRCRFDRRNARVWSPQRQLKLFLGIEIQRQHQGEKFCGTLEAEILFYMPIPTSLKKNNLEKTFHTKKPDIDNLIKLIFDVLSSAEVIKDDRIISSLITKKIYDIKPRTEIVLRELR
jgi:Holliday junction resolvase RusA-like endonuclease